MRIRIEIRTATLGDGGDRNELGNRVAEVLDRITDAIRLRGIGVSDLLAPPTDDEGNSIGGVYIDR